MPSSTALRTRLEAPDIDEAVPCRYGITALCTHDRDFRQFGFLEVRDPLDAAG